MFIYVHILLLTALFLGLVLYDTVCGSKFWTVQTPGVSFQGAPQAGVEWLESSPKSYNGYYTLLYPDAPYMEYLPTSIIELSLKCG